MTQNKTQKHTPTPWIYDPNRTEGDFCIYREGASPMIEKFESPDGLKEVDIGIKTEDGVIGCSEWINLTDANAAHIVHCVNNMPRAVELLKQQRTLLLKLLSWGPNFPEALEVCETTDLSRDFIKELEKGDE